MAISTRAAGSWSAATTQNVAYTIPSGYQAGDLGILVSVWRPFSVTATIDQGWTEIFDGATGSTANGNGVGSSRLYVAVKELSASETNPTVTRSGAITPGGGVIIVLQKASNDVWDYGMLVAAAVEQAMGSTAMSHALTTNAAVQDGDWIFALTGVADESATFTRATTAISGGGITYNGNIVEYPGGHLSSITGNDIAASLIYRAVTTGVASGASITVTATLTAAERVGSVLFRVGVDAGVSQIDLGLLDASPALYAPTVTRLSNSAYANEILGDSPIAYWRLGESSGSDAAAEVGVKGTYQNAPTLGATGALNGDSDTAVTFNGTDEYMLADDITGFPVGSAVRSLEFWYSSADSVGTFKTIVGYGTANTNQTFKVMHDNGGGLGGRIGVSTGGTDNWYGSGLTNTGFHHVVAVVESSTSIRVYIDGVDAGAQTFPTLATVLSGTDRLSAGYFSCAYLACTVDEIAVYDVALTGTQVGDHYAAGTGGSASITLGLLNAGPALYAPTLAVGPVGITLGLLDASAAVYAPTLTTRYAITLALLDAGPALYAPTLTKKNLITLALLDASPALYAPTLTPKSGITLVLLDGAPALYAPTLAPQAVLVSLGLLDASSALYAPTITQSGGIQSLSLGLLDASPALYAPTLVGKNALVLALIESTPALYAPSLTLAPYPITLGLLTSTSALYAPNIGQFSQITLGLLDASAALYAPTLTTRNAITLALLNASPALYAPTLSQAAQQVTLALLDASPALYAPTIVPAAYPLTLTLLDASRALYAPALETRYTVTLGFLDGSSALYAPTLSTGTGIITLTLLDASSALYAPTIIGAVLLGGDPLTPVPPRQRWPYRNGLRPVGNRRKRG